MLHIGHLRNFFLTCQVLDKGVASDTIRLVELGSSTTKGSE